MYNELRNIEKREDGYIYITNKFGFVAQIPEECEEDLQRFAELRTIGEGAPEFIYQLADAGLLTFDDYEPANEHFLYDDALINHSGTAPIYPGPVISHLAITNKCNMGCAYCSVRDMHDKIDDTLSTEQYKKIIDILADSGTFQIGLTGGEPTLHPDICELVKYVTDKNIACNITTNGWAMTDELADALVAAGLTQCQISIDSSEAAIHEKYRTSGSFDRAISCAKKMMERGVIVGADCVVSRENLDGIPKLIEFLEENGFLGLTLIKLKKGHLSPEAFSEAMVDYNEYAKLIDWICHLDSKMEITVDCSSVSNLCQTITDDEMNALHSAGCPVGHTLVSIAPNGDVYPCAALTEPKFKLGNILEDNFAEIWHDSPILCEMRDIKANVAGKCGECDKLDMCRGGCRGITWALDENLFASDPSCLYTLE